MIVRELPGRLCEVDLDCIIISTWLGCLISRLVKRPFYTKQRDTLQSVNKNRQLEAISKRNQQNLSSPEQASTSPYAIPHRASYLSCVFGTNG